MSERLRRWRLVLGGGDADGTQAVVAGDDLRRDRTLEALYGGDDRSGDRRGGLGASSPRVTRWLGDIRTYFPSNVVQVLQRDAIDRLGLRQLLLEPETLGAVQPDVHLVGTLLALRDAIPDRSRDAVRAVIRDVVDQLERRLAAGARETVGGALGRVGRTRRPRAGDVDWNRTIARNLRRYQPELRTVIPEVLVGHGRRAPYALRHLVLCVDQSASMAASAVHAAVLAAVLASVRTLRTSLVVFDTAVVDLTDELVDPVDVLLGLHLGGGTDIDRALAHCQALVDRPGDTILVLVSDLFEGGDPGGMLRRAAALVHDGVNVVVLLALDDEGAPAFDHDNAAALGELGVPCFACSPDLFAGLMATAVARGDVSQWAAANGIVVRS